MTSKEEENTSIAASEGIQQIPPVIRVREVPAAVEAREKLLLAIAAEASGITSKPGETGQASADLERLAHAYALVTSGATAVAPADEMTPISAQARSGGHKVGLCLELEP